jgi:hypothetical protein
LRPTSRPAGRQSALKLVVLLILDSLAEDLDLPLHLDPEIILVQVVITAIDAAAARTLVVADENPGVARATARSLALGAPRDGEERGNEGLLDVGEAEAVGDLGNGPAQLVGELDVLV